MNYKGSFDNLNCTVCNKEKEYQKHIIECKKILEMRENEKKVSENVNSQKEIAKYLKKIGKLKTN